MDNKGMAYCACAEDALADAENQCLRKLGETLALRPGDGIFCALQPGRTDCAVFDVGYLYTGDQAGYPANVFHFRAKLDLYSRDRAKLQRWLMRLFLTFPVGPSNSRSNEMMGEGPVINFRLAPESTGVGEISTIAVKQSADDPGRETFYCVAKFDVVFSAAERRADDQKG